MISGTAVETIPDLTKADRSAGAAADRAWPVVAADVVTFECTCRY